MSIQNNFQYEFTTNFQYVFTNNFNMFIYISLVLLSLIWLIWLWAIWSLNKHTIFIIRKRIYNTLVYTITFVITISLSYNFSHINYNFIFILVVSSISLSLYILGYIIPYYYIWWKKLSYDKKNYLISISLYKTLVFCIFYMCLYPFYVENTYFIYYGKYILTFFLITGAVILRKNILKEYKSNIFIDIIKIFAISLIFKYILVCIIVNQCVVGLLLWEYIGSYIFLTDGAGSSEGSKAPELPNLREAYPHFNWGSGPGGSGDDDEGNNKNRKRRKLSLEKGMPKFSVHNFVSTQVELKDSTVATSNAVVPSSSNSVIPLSSNEIVSSWSNSSSNEAIASSSNSVVVWNPLPINSSASDSFSLLNAQISNTLEADRSNVSNINVNINNNDINNFTDYPAFERYNWIKSVKFVVKNSEGVNFGTMSAEEKIRYFILNNEKMKAIFLYIPSGIIITPGNRYEIVSNSYFYCIDNDSSRTSVNTKFAQSIPWLESQKYIMEASARQFMTMNTMIYIIASDTSLSQIQRINNIGTLLGGSYFVPLAEYDERLMAFDLLNYRKGTISTIEDIFACKKPTRFILTYWSERATSDMITIINKLIKNGQSDARDNYIKSIQQSKWISQFRR